MVFNLLQPSLPVQVAKPVVIGSFLNRLPPPSPKGKTQSSPLVKGRGRQMLAAAQTKHTSIDESSVDLVFVAPEPKTKVGFVLKLDLYSYVSLQTILTERQKEALTEHRKQAGAFTTYTAIDAPSVCSTGYTQYASHRFSRNPSYWATVSARAISRSTFTASRYQKLPRKAQFYRRRSSSRYDHERSLNYT